MPRLVVRRLGVRACTTLIADERDNVSGADIGIEGLRKSRHRHDSQSSRSDENRLHSLPLMLLSRPSQFACPPCIALLVIVER